MLLLLTLFSPALAADEAPSPAARQAEAVRLSAELHEATRSAKWKAAERYYIAAVATGMPLAATAHFEASEAARTRGDLGAVRDRLIAALTIDPTHDQAAAALSALDRSYGQVKLASVPGATLEDYEHPFDPNAIRAVDHAIAALAETGRFTGLLPPGPYSIDGDPFEVVAGKLTVLDLSPPPVPPAEKKPWWRGR